MTDTVREKAEKIADYLFTNGAGQKATRLLLVQDDGLVFTASVNLGGWCKQAVVDYLAAEFAETRTYRDGLLRAAAIAKNRDTISVVFPKGHSQIYTQGFGTACTQLAAEFEKEAESPAELAEGPKGDNGYLAYDCFDCGNVLTFYGKGVPIYLCHSCSKAWPANTIADFANPHVESPALEAKGEGQ